ncbi:hypothetical protein SERLA73DRAFT_186261 [Serpula lacrymans var. lacrymans S7.3]|uniref:Protein kinase domain-containing protein n=2 Tax=Serpula lacrymans var. lacrymans TaxID=341189 RepID=F8Q5M7_SERL3|nr:uncharacterized protein SERLADRAFT_475213 [Serpula lacrymans var. lacrymans S7.9]EGN96498.1 hypothetical protein SERLA73DRAFT_186261 [Serpula lacrymans var. lacrymans S7.3]EGO22046.1 hypothetical protein SERLADRAFT_475213 [Serpula lacrymans var. lacrymans S7.9]
MPVRYVVYMPDNPSAQCYPFYVPEGAEVADLKAAIRGSPDYRRTLENENIILLKCGELSMEPENTLLNRATEWLREHSSGSKMTPAHRLKRYFPRGPAPEDHEKIDIVVVTDSILEAGDKLPGLDIAPSNLIQMSVRRAADVRDIRSPSEISKDIKLLKDNSGSVRGDLYIHRPARNYGPHTSLFHHAFARLKHRLDRLDDPTIWQPDLEPSSELLGLCHSFISGSAELYDNEPQRRVLLKPFFESVLLDHGSYETKLDDRGGIADATWGDPLIVIREDKNEPGVGGDSSLQGWVYFRKAVAQESYKPYVQRSNCPVVIIGVTGSRVEISTAMFIGGVYMDKLISQDLYIDAFQAKMVLHVGRMCQALRLCYNDLKEYYRALDLKAAPTTGHLYPSPLPARDYDTIPALKYMCKLSHGGQCIQVMQEERREEADAERPYAIYRAKMIDSDGEADVVVKFTARYNKAAHKLLETEQLAPRLRYFARLISDHCMVVTDYVESLPLSDCPKQKNYLDILDRVERAVQLLHRGDLVFGDLRPQNIVLHPNEGAMLIDFDFAGTHGVDRYPASFDTSRHHRDVRRHGIMDKEHDIFMISELRKILERANKSV